MKKFLLLAIFSLFLCAPAHASGLFYTNATYPVTATGLSNQDLYRLKQGSSTTKNILFLVETGDASIDKAAKRAGITKISHIDVHEYSIFIFYRKLTVTVYGE